ncbi:MAG: hypothetical protein WA608_16905, partial [Candidatus Acidiferrales bacterium]
MFTSCRRVWLGITTVAAIGGIFACSGSSQPSSASSGSAATASPAASQSAPPKLAEGAPPADQTGGFDGAKAYEHVAKIVSFGPRPPASEALHQTQDYIL